MKKEFLESECCNAKILFVDKPNRFGEMMCHAVCEKCLKDCKSKSIMQ